MALLESELYVESGYIETGYAGGIAQGAVSLEPYFEEGYIETGYAVTQGSEFSLLCNTDSVIVNAEATISAEFTITSGGGKLLGVSVAIESAFTPTMTVVVQRNAVAILDTVTSMTVQGQLIKTSSVTLETIVNISLQNDRIRPSNDVNLGPDEFTTLFTLNVSGIKTAVGSIQSDAVTAVSTSAVKTASGSANFNALFANIATALNVQFLDPTNLSTVSTLTADPIEYRLRSNDITPGQRPHYPTSIAPFTSFSTDKVLGSHSLQTIGSTTLVNRTWVTYTIADGDMILPNSGSNATQVEFWLKGTNEVRLHDTSSVTNWLITKTATNNIFAYTDVNSNNANSRLDGLGTSGFDHIVVRWNRSTMAMWVNGVRSDYYAGAQDRSPTTNSNLRLSFNRNPDYFSGLAWGGSQLDEFRVLTGTETELNSALGYTVDSTTIPVPSSEFTNTANTRILLHFNNSYLDDDAGIQLFYSYPSAVSTLTVTPSTSGFIQADLSSVVDLVADGTRRLEGSAALESTVTQTVIGDRIVDATADLTSAFVTEVNGNKIVTVETDFESIATSVTVAAKTSVFFVNADLVATLNAETTVTSGSVVNIIAQATQVTNNTRQRNSGSDLDSTTNVSATVVKTVTAASESNSVFTQTVDVIKTLGVIANLNSEFVLSAQGTLTNSSSVNEAMVFDLNATGVVTRSAASNANSEFDLTAITTTLLNGSANLESFTAVLSVARKINTDSIVYTVQNELRVYRIPRETRTHSITAEDRTYIIVGAA